MTMPDLPPAEKSVEQRRALKWWIQHCHIQEEKIGELRESLRELLPIVMAYYSEEIWCAGWMENLEALLTTDGDHGYIKPVANAAGLLGEIPFWDDDTPENGDGMNIGWRKYPLK